MSEGCCWRGGNPPFRVPASIPKSTLLRIGLRGDTPLVDQKPGDPQSWNLYAYVRNNPLANVDPTGQNCGDAGFVASGGCAVDQLSGIFVGGIIDGNSINLASQSDSLSLMYTPAQQQDPTLPTEVAPPPPSIADRVAGALMPKSYGDIVSMALMIPTDGLGEVGGLGETVLTRYGTEAESTVEKLAGDAAKAEENIGVHGVSATSKPNPPIYLVAVRRCRRSNRNSM